MLAFDSLLAVASVAVAVFLAIQTFGGDIDVYLLMAIIAVAAFAALTWCFSAALMEILAFIGLWPLIAITLVAIVIAASINRRREMASQHQRPLS